MEQHNLYIYIYIHIYICIKQFIFCNHIYFSTPYIFKMLDLHLQTKKNEKFLDDI